MIFQGVIIAILLAFAILINRGEYFRGGFETKEDIDCITDPSLAQCQYAGQGYF